MMVFWSFSYQPQGQQASGKYDLMLSELHVSGKEATTSVGVIAEHGHSCFTGLLQSHSAACIEQVNARPCTDHVFYTWTCVFPPGTHAADQPSKGTTPLPRFSWPIVTRAAQLAFLNPRHLPLDMTPFSALSPWICEMWFESRSKSKPLQGVWEFRFQPAPISNLNFFNKAEISRCTQTAENYQQG